MSGYGLIIAGIDPGKSGAMVILYPDNTPFVFDVPLAGSKPAWTLWGEQWSGGLEFHRPDKIFIENVSAMPKQGVTSMFNFGEALGFAHGLVKGVCRSSVVEWPTPSQWMKRMGLIEKGKDTSIEEARRLVPKLSHYLTLKKHHNRAEAALIACYGRKVS